ncbi:MAG: hypothetical protein SO365_03845, partial [Prevotella sp.]|nr:hypothetical protein [Prevotella sp.]
MPHWAARVVCMVRERKKRASLMVASLALCLQDGTAPACQKAAGAWLSRLCHFFSCETSSTVSRA